MNAIDRAERDERAGDFGSAKRRMQSYLATVGYSPEICERLARLSLRMGDPAEAGRWYFLADSTDPEAAPSIERFTTECSHNGRHILSRLPAKTRLDALDRYPAAVRSRFEHFGLRRVPSDLHEVPRTWRTRLAEVGCAAFALAFVVLVALGAGYLAVMGVKAIIDWLG